MSPSAGPRGRNPTAVEPFVRRIVAGGLALVAGLWLAALLDPSGWPWLVGPALAFAGLASLAAGIARPLSVDWPGRSD
ncbi:MAG: hypothetical protein ABEJ92_07815 [Halobacteriales archaeon]